MQARREDGEIFGIKFKKIQSSTILHPVKLPFKVEGEILPQAQAGKDWEILKLTALF